ncbi:nucleotidyl transferase AbiEii/AbiGii toxin family protein [Candidatus Peregrinibacteria bacterium]|nr:nucleotidyl transferase AbiEii/AbiGii toxin family protein [Candidatus Peregrinibacteria bacterium]
MNYELFLQAFKEKYNGVKDTQMLFQYLREELQYLILQALYTKMSYPIYFMGGTLLRLSYGLNRFSEDIDLSLEAPDPNFPSETFHEELLNAFSEKITGFKVKMTLNTNRNVIKIMISFSKVLFDLGISPLPAQNIKIKLELDTNPPGEASYDRKMYRSMAGDYMVSTHDLPTAFAGKLCAVLMREYQKGRDYYDLQWYLQRDPMVPINLNYLNANYSQQDGEIFKNESELCDAIVKKIKNLDKQLMRRDLERFIMMEEGTFKEWLDRYSKDTLELLEIYKKAYES